jgi:sodium pump decarboxylase gamma subunit
VNWLNAWWQQVSSTVADGLQITIVGMALVFLTLGLIIVALILLTRLPGLRTNPKKDQKVATNPPSQEIAQEATDATDTKPQLAQDTELAQVAAIAVALLRSRQTTESRSRTKTSTSRWKQYGRAHQLGL